MPRVRRPLLALIALVLALAVGYAIRAARSDHPPHRQPATHTSKQIPLSALPEQVPQPVSLIARSGPFPHDDGAVSTTTGR